MRRATHWREHECRLHQGQQFYRTVHSQSHIDTVNHEQVLLQQQKRKGLCTDSIVGLFCENKKQTQIMEGRHVAVAVRVRPVIRGGGSAAHQAEKFELEAITRLGDTQIKVEQKRQDEGCRSSTFTFDYIFDQESTQLEVYEESVVDLVDATLCGANATILAYGQTGSGKTHSVLGEVKPNPLENDLLTHNSGLFLRVLSDLMEYKQRRIKEMHVVVGLSCVEIYNDLIRDLFGRSPNSDVPPTLRAVMIGDDVHLPSLIVKEVTSLQAVFGEIQLAIGRRSCRSTEANASSSRSHCLFMIDILQCPVSAPYPSLSILEQSGPGGDQKIGRTRGATVAGEEAKNRARSQTTTTKVSPTGSRSTTPVPTAAVDPLAQTGFIGTILRIPGQQEPVWASKILLADLAGSEKIRNSGVSGEGLAEATAINGSLTALGNVVHALHEGSYASYRTTNLTRLLKPTFSHPASRVLLLAQVAPTQLTFDETVSTLHFANKVKAMKVTTVTGADTEKQQFEYFEAEKTFDALCADLHIFHLESNVKPILRQHNGQSSWESRLLYDTKAKRPYKRDERKQFLEQSGAVRAAEDAKRQAAAKKAEEELKWAEELSQMHAKERDGLVMEYKESFDELFGAVQTESNAIRNHLQQMALVDCSAGSNVMRLEEDVAFAELCQAEFAARKGLLVQQVQSSDAELVSVEKQLGARSAAMKTGHHVDPADLNAETEYALACWAHCAAKRFFVSLMELREAQHRHLTLRCHSSTLSSWVEKLERRSDQPAPAQQPKK